MSIEIKPAYDDLDSVRELFIEYQAAIGLDLGFQGFEDELANLPGKYALPSGRLYIAVCGGDSAGCAALRRVSEEHCELKRLYVRERYRGSGIGRALTEKIICDAKAMGYRRIILDTLSSLHNAVSLYRRLGFADIEPYYNNPNDGVVFLGLDI